MNLKGCDENINKLSMKDFKLMKNTAYIINTARGKIIKEDDLIQAVKNKLIAGAVLDVIKMNHQLEMKLFYIVKI